MAMLEYDNHCACSVKRNDDIIHVDCASHVYPDGSQGIHNMCFHVHEKEIVAICGGNGSGKSTLLEHLNGLLRPSTGKVFVMGEEVTDATKNEIWRYVGLVFQRPDDQLFAPTVMDDVMFGPLNMGMSKEEARRVAIDALERVGAEGMTDRVPAYLSGGQKRLVAIAGVLAMKPRVIALDEPTSDLDTWHSELIERIVLRLRDTFGISVVLATHDLDMAARLADRVCILKDGAVAAEGTPRDVFYDKQIMESSGLAIPKVVEIYEDYCYHNNMEPDMRPLNVHELIDAMR